MGNLHKYYYKVRPFIPRTVQIGLRRRITRKKFAEHAGDNGTWPIDEEAAKTPPGWPGWPDGKQFALVLTHDVDTLAGHNRCIMLSKIEEERGLRSSFNFVPERYPLTIELLSDLMDRGFEVGVHGLYHDGRLYDSREEFLQRAEKINKYLRQWGAVGFRSPAMQHNLDWIHDLHIEYDASTFDTDPFEPQPDGAKTIFPFWVNENGAGKGYMELPYTLAQDFTLFVLLKQRNTEIWERKLDWIAENGGLALLNSHPDYMCFKETRQKCDEYPIDYYVRFLDLIQSKFHDTYWHALPKNAARYCKPHAENHKKVGGGKL
ncbi:MAG: hypothetical protein R6X27_17175 [Candidatus Desulfacyla sp.]